MLRSIAQGALAGLREAALPLPAACRLQGPAASCTSVLSRCYTAEPAHERKLSRASSESKFGAITIGQVMKEKAESGDPRASLFWCQPQDKAFEAIKKMAEANVGSILVMKSSDPHRSQVEGIITERDYLRKVAVTGKSSKEMACSALMTPAATILTLTPDDTVAQAMRVMEEKNIRHLPVYEGDRLLGMMSIKDIVSTFMDQHEADIDSMSEYIAGASY